MSANTIEITDANFDASVLKSEQPVIVDFWAEWCRPCKMMAPIFEEVAQSFSGKVIFGKMDVSGNQNIPAKYGVMGIPTLILFKGGNIQATQVGAISKAELIAFINGNL